MPEVLREVSVVLGFYLTRKEFRNTEPTILMVVLSDFDPPFTYLAIMRGGFQV